MACATFTVPSGGGDVGVIVGVRVFVAVSVGVKVLVTVFVTVGVAVCVGLGVLVLVGVVVLVGLMVLEGVVVYVGSMVGEMPSVEQATRKTITRTRNGYIEWCGNLIFTSSFADILSTTGD